MENNRMGEFLAALRKSKGYTQQEVADTLGVSNKTVSSWETGASCPDISMLPVLAELYGVTCDELIRGKRLSGEEELSPAGRKKAMEHLLQRQKTNLFTVCWIAGGLAGIALLLTSLIGFAALESPIGFFVGLIFQAASIITAVICIRRLRFQAGEPWESEPALRFSLSLDRALFWIVIANVAVFGFDAPHCFVPAMRGWLWTEKPSCFYSSLCSARRHSPFSSVGPSCCAFRRNACSPPSIGRQTNKAGHFLPSCAKTSCPFGGQSASRSSSSCPLPSFWRFR